MNHLAESFFGTLHMVDQHHITLFCPKGRQETQISPKLTPCVWGRKVCQVAGQRYIVLRIEYM